MNQSIAVLGLPTGGDVGERCECGNDKSPHGDAGPTFLEGEKSGNTIDFTLRCGAAYLERE